MKLNISKKSVHIVLAMLSFASLASLPQDTHAQANRNPAAYNLQSGVGLKGYDPVAVFPEGGGQAAMGNPEIRTEHLGVVYHFASTENQSIFATNPEKYEPTYGGWCAYAMASGSQVDIQPDLFTINGNRAHYFVSGRAKRNFDSYISGYESRADDFWKQISGEEPRL